MFYQKQRNKKPKGGFMSNDRNNETKRVKTTGKTKKVKKSSSSKSEKVNKVKFKNRHPKAAKAIRIGLIVFILLAIIGAGVLVGAFFGIFGDELKISPESLVVGYENSTVYDADGNQIAVLSAGSKRKSIGVEEMSEYLPKAYVAIEDEGFYDHNGIDISRTAYATLTYVLNGGKSSFGGSTITQQVIKNITQDKERTALAGVMRKVKEISKAIQVEQYLSKDQILELYLNLIFVGGDDINGVELGSIYYFNKSAKDLSIAECAYMAGINHSPNLYKPFKEYTDDEEGKKNKEEMDNKIKTRTKTVLMKMEELGYISKDQYDEACGDVDKGLKFERGESADTTVDVSYVTEAAIDQILDKLIAENEDMDREMAEIQLYSNGYKTYTTQKSDIQTIVEEEIVNEKFFTSTTKTIEDKETGEKKKETQYSNPTIVIMDHKTGHVVAAATATGSKEERTATTKLGYLNFPTKIKKQTGSSMKPLSVIAPGVQNNIITGATVYYNQKTTWGKGAGAWSPKNSTGYSEFSTMRTAIEKSHNIPHAKALTNITSEVAVEFCKQLGFPDFTAEGLSLALGGLDQGVAPADMAGGYATIANDGVYKTPIFYTKVEDAQGNVIFEASQEEREVMSPQNAYIVKDILKQPVISGTATYCRIANMDVAAKTGTTNDDFDRWLCGFTPYYTGACWYGYEESAKVKYSGNPAGYLWDAIMTRIHEDLELEPAKFEEPEGIIRRSICRISGKLSGPNCGEGNAYTEVFTEENVPKTTCEGHGQITICNESKQLATPHCPDQVPCTGYIPDNEKGAIWVTDRMVQSDITVTCPLHGGGAPIAQPTDQQPAPTPTPEPTPAPSTDCSHSSKDTKTTKPTCGKAGSEIVVCKSCGKEISNKSLPATGKHTWSEWKTTSEPTATSAGKKERKCSVCGNTQSESIDKLRTHTCDYSVLVSDSATCTAAGDIIMKCSSCTSTQKKPSPAKGHDFSGGGATCKNCSEPNPNYEEQTTETPTT